MNELNMKAITDRILELGAYRVGVIKVSDIQFDRRFRDLCESNSCGKYGKCWACPPAAGAIDDLISLAKEFESAIVYQTVGTLEDSYDFEGMMEAGKTHNDLSQVLSEEFKDVGFSRTLHLGAGGCRVCEKCSKLTEEPCRFPDKAMKSLETFGIDVSALAKISGMNYINGQDTVTYFGALFYNL